MNPPVALTIAGSDSGAGAGLQADLKTFAAHGVFGASVVTAVTAQNTTEVIGAVAMEPAFVELQLEAVLSDLPVGAVKTGMLATVAIIEVVAQWAEAGRLPNLVVDPVLVASSGRPLLDDGGPRAYVERLLPRALVAMPNSREASLLTGVAVGDLESMIGAARELAKSGARYVVVKGGHLPGATSPDVVVADGGVEVLQAVRVESANDHGTGCTMASAVAALLASGSEPEDAIRHAKSYVAGAIRGAAGWHLGRGHGPLDHFGWGAAKA